MPSLLPVPTISRNSDSIISGSSASLAAHPRPNDPFCIPRPTSWGSRHECLGEEWYNEHRDKTFHTLQYRKDNMAPWHEFILLFLTDGSVCRVERMGDVTPERRHDALFSKGIPAVDYMQVFPPPGVSAKGINPGPQPIEDGSILVAEIIYPIEVKLLSVLDICYAIQLDSETRRYNLWTFNCYFFAWSIILIVGRQVAQWESAFECPHWDEACDKLAKKLSSCSQQPFGRLAFKLEKMLANPEQDTITAIVAQHVWRQNISLNQRAKSLLWTKQTPEIMKQRLEHSIRHSTSEKTFRILFPEFGGFSLKSPITPVETRPWERDQQTLPHAPVSVPPSEKTKGPSLQIVPSDSYKLPTFSEFLQAPMYEASSFVLGVVYSGVKSVTQPDQKDGTQSPPITPGDWRAKLGALVKAMKKESGSTSENQFISIINSHPEVDGVEWRQALVQVCDEQVPFFKASPLPRLWDQWLWDAITEGVCGEIGALIPKSEQVNVGVNRPGREQEWMSNGQLQAYINERMKEHSQLVYKYSRQPTSDIYNQLSEAIEEVWERVSLGDGKCDYTGLASMFRAVQDVVFIPRE